MFRRNYNRKALRRPARQRRRPRRQRRRYRAPKRLARPGREAKTGPPRRTASSRRARGRARLRDGARQRLRYSASQLSEKPATSNGSRASRRSSVAELAALDTPAGAAKHVGREVGAEFVGLAGSEGQDQSKGLAARAPRRRPARLRAAVRRARARRRSRRRNRTRRLRQNSPSRRAAGANVFEHQAQRVRRPIADAPRATPRARVRRPATTQRASASGLARSVGGAGSAAAARAARPSDAATVRSNRIPASAIAIGRDAIGRRHRPPPTRASETGRCGGMSPLVHDALRRRNAAARSRCAGWGERLIDAPTRQSAIVLYRCLDVNSDLTHPHNAT